MKDYYKGVSPLIASVFLIAITVTIATLLSGWVSTVTRTTQVSAENKTAEAVECAAAVILIEDVYVQDTGANAIVNAFVRNSGQANDLIIGNATVYNTSGGSLTATAPSVPLSDFDRGEVVTFTFTNAPIPSCPTNFQEVIVTTNCGGVSAKFDKSPKCS